MILAAAMVIAAASKAKPAVSAPTPLISSGAIAATSFIGIGRVDGNGAGEGLGAGAASGDAGPGSVTGAGSGGSDPGAKTPRGSDAGCSHMAGSENPVPMAGGTIADGATVGGAVAGGGLAGGGVFAGRIVMLPDADTGRPDSGEVATAVNVR